MADAVKVELWELARLQDFPDDYPFQGNRTSVARQIGNACPATLAAVVVDVLVSSGPGQVHSALPGVLPVDGLDALGCPSYSAVVEACCERVCMGCDDARHPAGAHSDLVVKIIDELIDRGWLVCRDAAAMSADARAAFEAGKWA